MAKLNDYSRFSKYGIKHVDERLNEHSWLHAIRNSIDMNKMRDEMRSKHPASGIHDFGKHGASRYIADGLYYNPDSNFAPRLTLYSGRYRDAVGNSESPFPRTLISGFLMSLRGINTTSTTSCNWLRFQDAPDGMSVGGTKWQRPVRNSSKSVLNLRKDIDPKYGDVANTDEEACARAFEGSFINGNFRNGKTGWGQANSIGLEVADSIATLSESANGSDEYLYQTISVEEGDRIDFSISILELDLAVTGLYIEFAWGGSAIHDTLHTNGLGEFRHQLITPTDVGGQLQVRMRLANVTSGWVKFTNVQCHVNEEVITQRMDLYGMEYFLEEVTKENPFVYDGGNINSQAASIEGIATSISNRPSSYYSAWLGDTIESRYIFGGSALITIPLIELSVGDKVKAKISGVTNWNGGTHNSIFGDISSVSVRVLSSGVWDIDGVELKVDGVVISNGEAAPIDGGEHTIEATIQSGTIVLDRFAARNESGSTRWLGGLYDVEFITAKEHRFYPINDGYTSEGKIAELIGGKHGVAHDFSSDSWSTIGTGIRGMGINFWSLSVEDKLKLVSLPEMNLFNLGDDLVPKICQFRSRYRNEVGQANGYWHTTNPYSKKGTNGLQSTSSLSSRLPVQGARDMMLVPDTLEDANEFFGTHCFVQMLEGDNEWNLHPNRGIFTNQKTTDSETVNGECYFEVWGLSPRLNQGAYHPTLNEAGTASFGAVDGGTGKVYQRRYWNQAQAGREVYSLQDCFGPRILWNRDVPSDVRAFRYDLEGSVEHGFGIRPDNNKFHDMIYDDGFNGIIDLRKPCWDVLGSEYYDRSFNKLMVNTYRGLERPNHIKLHRAPRGITYQGTQSEMYKWNARDADFVIDDGAAGSAGENRPVIGWLVQGEIYSPVTYLFQASSSTITQIYCGHGTYEREMGKEFANEFNDTDPIYFVRIDEVAPYELSGKFLTVCVAGHPEHILTHPELRNGWVGNWSRTIPTGALRSVELERRTRSSATVKTDICYPDKTWGLFDNTAIDQVRSQLHNRSSHAGEITLYTHYAVANQVIESSIFTPAEGDKGLERVVQIAHSNEDRGSFLAQSLAGVNITSNLDNNASLGNYALTEAKVNGQGSLDIGVWGWPRHERLTTQKPKNNSPMLKMLPYAGVEGAELTVCMLYNEVRWKAMTAERVPTTHTAWEQGKTYIIEWDAEAKERQLIQCISSAMSGAFISNFAYTGGEWRHIVDGSNGWLVDTPDPTGAWGDDGEMRLIHGRGSFMSYNNLSCRYGAGKLAIPLGYTWPKSWT